MAIYREEVDPTLSLEEAKAEMGNKLDQAEAALQENRLDEVAGLLEEVRAIAERHGISVPPTLETYGTELEREQAYQAKFATALKAFCQENYGAARLAFLELEQAKPSDPEPGRYIERMYFNNGIVELQSKRPWEAVYYFETVLKRNAGDAEVQELKQFAEQFGKGDPLDYKYISRVDRLQYRNAGCE